LDIEKFYNLSFDCPNNFVHEKVDNRDIIIKLLSTVNQTANIFTKGLNSNQFFMTHSKTGAQIQEIKDSIIQNINCYLAVESRYIYIIESCVVHV
jgi:hypothetical protein